MQREIVDLGDKIRAAQRAHEAAKGDPIKQRASQFTINRLTSKRNKFQEQANVYQVEFNRLTTIRDRHEQMPIWDATGFHASGRFQFQTGCMVKAGNDCGCYLVDTLIGESDRATCTKGEWLQGSTFDLGYDNFEADRVFDIKILSLEIGDGQTLQEASKLRHETNVYVRGRPSTCDTGAQKEMPCEETRQTSMRFGINNPNDGFTASSLTASWEGDGSSSFVVYIPRALDNFCFNLFVVDTDNLESRNSVWRKLHPFTESDREVSSLCVKGGAAQADDAAKSIYRVDCAKDEIKEGVCTKEATWQAKPLTKESTFSKFKAKVSMGLFDTDKGYSTTGVDVKLKVRITQRNAKAMAKAGASVAAGNLRDSCAINRIAPPTEGEAADTSGGVESLETDALALGNPIPDAIPDSEFQLKVEASFSLAEAGALTAVKPLATCSKVEKGSPACPKLTKDDANGKWAVVQEERAEPPETDARNGDRAEPRKLTLQPGPASRMCD